MMDSIYHNLNKKNWMHYKNMNLTMTITKKQQNTHSIQDW